MRSLKIAFRNSGPVFDFGTFNSGFDGTVQNALVNVGTNQGTDPLYPDRGTTLAKDAAQGRMVNSVWAAHTTNFAALSTLSFIQKTEAQDDLDRLQDFQLEIELLQSQQVKLNVFAKSSLGETRGLKVTI